jgi:DNA-binding NarL/FixJ family response regulator
MKAIVADEWSVLRGGVAAVLAQCGVSTPIQAATGTEAVAAAERDAVDLVVLGTVPDVTPAVALARLRAVRPDVRVLVLLEGSARTDAIEVLDAGADALVSRSASEVDLREAALKLSLGQRYVSPGMLATAFGPAPATERTANPFTDRERSVLSLLASGRSNREIADALFIGEATVKTHLRNIYDKLDVANRAQAVARIHELKLLG